MAGSNLYSDHYLFDEGQFFRCRHKHTDIMPCWKCGLWHPIDFIKHLIVDMK